MHLHILGLSGTFMSALAILAKEAGFIVTGSDAHCYPPVSDLLANNGISWTEGYDDTTDALKADVVIVGNAIKRGMPVMEAVLDAGIPYTSGPQWFAEHILPKRRVIAVAGTHGKTTTTSMLAFILHHAGLNPGFLIGGVASNFNTSARLGCGEWFVVEADEYDSAFFDKRPKFMHYRPDVAILNNLEFDHADIYSNLEAIQQQFHYLLRTIPAKGLVIKPRDDQALNAVINRGIYSRLDDVCLNGEATWRAELLNEQGQSFRIWHKGLPIADVNWSLIGAFNVENALAAFAASIEAGVEPLVAAKALEQFSPVKRRLEVKSSQQGVVVYDDFAHHPTAIKKTIQALKQSNRHQRILVVLEFASYTMRSGIHGELMKEALDGVDFAWILNPAAFSLDDINQHWTFPYQILPSTHLIVDSIGEIAQAGDAVLVMSNRGFDNIHQQISANIRKRSLKVTG